VRFRGAGLEHGVDRAPDRAEQGGECAAAGRGAPIIRPAAREASRVPSTADSGIAA